jgi:hypothetical protein
VLIAEQLLELWSRHQLLQKVSQGPPAHLASLRKHLVIEEPLAVFSECGEVLDRIVGAQTDKPAVQKVVVELIEQKPLLVHPVERTDGRNSVAFSA